MKRFTLILIAFVLFSCHNEDEIDFKIGYLPNKSYTLSQNQVSENKVYYSGDEKTLQNIKDNGVDNPTITNTSSVLKSLSITGESIGEKFPISIEVLESSSKSLNKGMMMYGNQVNGVTKIDSINNTSMTEDYKQELLSSMESTMNSIKYPEGKLKIGDSFEQKAPMSLPIADVVINIEINTIYTLSEIKEGFGVFDIEQIYSMKSATKDYEIVLDGVGEGEIYYNIQNQFFTKMNIESEMNCKTDLNSVIVELITTSNTNQSTLIN